MFGVFYIISKNIYKLTNESNFLSLKKYSLMVDQFVYNLQLLPGIKFYISPK
jgi:hypothetical protein